MALGANRMGGLRQAIDSQSYLLRRITEHITGQNNTARSQSVYRGHIWLNGKEVTQIHSSKCQLGENLVELGNFGCFNAA